MKNLFSKKMVEESKINDLIFNLGLGLFCGYLTGVALFIMSTEKDISLYTGIAVGIVGVYSVYTHDEYRFAAAIFAVMLPLITIVTYLRLGLNLETVDLAELFFFLQGLIISTVLGSIVAFFHHKYGRMMAP